MKENDVKILCQSYRQENTHFFCDPSLSFQKKDVVQFQKNEKIFEKGKGTHKKRAHLVKLVYTIDSKSVPVFPGYRFESDSE